MTKFADLQKEGELTKEKLKDFVEDYFLPAGNELDTWIPPDWTARYNLKVRVNSK